MSVNDPDRSSEARDPAESAWVEARDDAEPSRDGDGSSNSSRVLGRVWHQSRTLPGVCDSAWTTWQFCQMLAHFGRTLCRHKMPRLYPGAATAGHSPAAFEHVLSCSGGWNVGDQCLPPNHGCMITSYVPCRGETFGIACLDYQHAS